MATQDKTPQDAPAGRPAAPAALIGVGAAGRRLVARVRDRFAREAPPNAGGLLLLDTDDGVSLPAAVRDAARRLMRQRSVSALEEQYAIRRPERRYLTLHLVFAAALAETDADALLGCLEAAYGLDHPPAGLEVLFLLDATGAADGGVPDTAPLLQALDDAGRAWRERQARRWSASGRLRILLAHPHRADGSWLDHPCLFSAPEVGLPEDEFEETLAAALAAHLASGPFFDGLAAGDDARPFALWGWARETLPRQRILQGAADLLTADTFERTAAPEPGADARDAASLVEQDAPSDWEAWVLTRDDVLLDRRALIKRLLRAERPGAVTAEDALPPQSPRPSLFQGFLTRFFGAAPAAPADERRLRVRLGLRVPGWQSGRPKTWPDALERLDAEGAQACEALLEELRAQGRPRAEAEAVCKALARCVDVCVRRHLGGTRAAHAMISEAERSARDRIAAPALPFAGPDVPDGLGLPDGVSPDAAREIYRERCARQPGWAAILSAGLACGALGAAALAAFHLPALLLAGPWVAACLLTAGARQAWALGRLKRMGEYLCECLCAKYGRRLLDWAEQAAGDSAHEGVYQAVLHFLDESERPAVARFEAERAAVVARLRQTPPFPMPIGTDGFLADERAVADLYALARETVGESALADDARSLLRQMDVFAAWRVPTLDTDAAAQPFVRRTRLASWERPVRNLGDFLRDIHALHAPDASRDAAFAAWVRGRMDRLALRAVPLALLPPSHPERGGDADVTRAEDLRLSVTTAAPASLEWRAAGEPSPADPSQPPVDSGVHDLVAWFGVDASAGGVIPAESEATACLVLLSGLSVAEILSAFPPFETPDLIADAASTLPSAAPVNGSNGHTVRPVYSPVGAVVSEGEDT